MKTPFLLAILFFSNWIASQTTITLQPDAATGKDAMLSQNNPTDNFGTYTDFLAQTWTFQGNIRISRSVIQFDLSAIPAGASILTARLSLYHAFDSGNAGHEGDNTAYLRRVTTNWDEETVTWNTQPTYTSVNEITLPSSTSPEQDYENIEVGPLVRDMLADPSNSFGFMFMLQNEVIYTSMLFFSSDAVHPTYRPKLEITYTTEAVDCITLQPGSEGKDATINDLNPSTTYPTHADFISFARTTGGLAVVLRSFIEFDLSGIPDNSEIVSATLSLYYNPISGDVGHEGENASYLRRITQPWEENNLTWNNQPSTTTTNQVILPTSSTTSQDYPNIDVTALVVDMIDNPSSSHGFMMRLVTEEIYRSLKFASGDHTDPARHPKLEVCYSSTVANKEIFIEEEFVRPNPFSNSFYLDNIDGITEIKISNISGKIVYKAVIENAGNPIFIGDLELLPAGIYLLHSKGHSVNYFSKIVKAGN